MLRNLNRSLKTSSVIFHNNVFKRFYSLSKDVKTNHLNKDNRSIGNSTNNFKHLSKNIVKVVESDLNFNIRIGEINNYFHFKVDANYNDPNYMTPSTFICTIDISGSMGESINVQDPEIGKFSRLDLVKHSLRLMIMSLRSCDKIAIVSYTTDSKIVLNPTMLDKTGTDSALKAVDKLQPTCSTNMFAGIADSVKIIESLQDSENIFVVNLTDGHSNIGICEGYFVQELKKMNIKNHFSFSNFGYGYDINGTLLNNLSKFGGGSFFHIPDFTMCSTVFVNYLANSLTTSVIDFKMNDEKMFPIRTGQTRNILKKENIVVNFSFDNFADFKITHSYDNFEKFEDSEYVFFIKKLINIMETCDITNYHPVFGEYISDLIRFRKTCKNIDIIVKIDSLIKNVVDSSPNFGQVTKAYNKDWYNRWGDNYLKNLISSHQNEICANFKDPSLQYYGGKLYREVRSEIEDIFSTIDIPQPSLSSQPFSGNFQQSFYSPTGPCFDGEMKVRTVKGLIKVKNLKKGDIIITSNGKTKEILCVVETKIENKSAPMCLIKTPFSFVPLRITPFHPINYRGNWIFPKEIVEPTNIHIESVYNFVLKNSKFDKDADDFTMVIQGANVITMGHNIDDEPVLKHPFFGSNKIIECLKSKPGFNFGKVVITKYEPEYDSEGIISWF